MLMLYCYLTDLPTEKQSQSLILKCVKCKEYSQAGYTIRLVKEIQNKSTYKHGDVKLMPIQSPHPYGLKSLVQEGTLHVTNLET